MNEIVHHFLLAGNKFMPKILKNQNLLIVLADYLLKTKEEFKI